MENCKKSIVNVVDFASVAYWPVSEHVGVEVIKIKCVCESKSKGINFDCSDPKHIDDLIFIADQCIKCKMFLSASVYLYSGERPAQCTREQRFPTSTIGIVTPESIYKLVQEEGDGCEF